MRAAFARDAHALEGLPGPDWKNEIAVGLVDQEKDVLSLWRNRELIAQLVRRRNRLPIDLLDDVALGHASHLRRATGGHRLHHYACAIVRRRDSHAQLGGGIA